MKTNFVQNNISFCKTLVATGSYLNNGRSEPCSFYKLDSEIDSDEVNKIYCSDQWKNSELMEAYKYNFDSEDWKLDEFYIVENNDAECIGITELYDPIVDCKSGKGIYILETRPENSSLNKKRETKYIGETILAFITKLTQREKGDVVDIPLACDEAVPFYTDKCFFTTDKKTDPDYTPVFLSSDNFFSLIKQNEEHTNSEIRFV